MDKKLKDGDKVRIHGFVMLKGLDNGKLYRVVQYRHGIYDFVGIKSGKTECRHYATDVDLWVNTKNDNRIEVIQ